MVLAGITPGRCSFLLIGAPARGFRWDFVEDFLPDTAKSQKDECSDLNRHPLLLLNNLQQICILLQIACAQKHSTGMSLGLDKLGFKVKQDAENMRGYQIESEPEIK
ncbi:hypothetical protein XELAEV_18043732mg [Xenopus laevis]|uniref:Uncharacterized protein n=1 Tax=Xenopus laevis TaxID=8355 RepID=A0A974BXH2_XENLA|nr:hypothetical protein XELAEV_18043732mg [Xenopus laevis]